MIALSKWLARRAAAGGTTAYSRPRPRGAARALSWPWGPGMWGKNVCVLLTPPRFSCAGPRGPRPCRGCSLQGFLACGVHSRYTGTQDVALALAPGCELRSRHRLLGAQCCRDCKPTWPSHPPGPRFFEHTFR